MKIGRGFLTSYMIIKRDFVAYYRGISWIVLLSLYFLVWVFFTAATLGNLVTIKNYLQYLVAGILVIGIYNASSNYAYVISGERRRGYLKYLISLPISRIGLAIGRVCAGMLQGLTFSIFTFIVAFLIIGLPGVMGLVILAATALCMTFGLSGLGVAIAVYFRSELMDPVNDMIGIWLLLFSTIFFPEQILPAPFRFAVTLNPMSAAANLLRVGFGLTAFSWLDVTILIAFTCFFVLASVAGYLHKMEITN